MTQKLDAATLRRLAVRASCSPGTIQKVYLGEPVRGLAYYRALAALNEAGIRPRSTPLAVVSGTSGEDAP